SHVLVEDQWTTAERMLTGACVAAEERAAAQTQHSVPELLVRAEDFVSGFEDDDEQEGVSQLLADLRTAIGRAN
uniref:hypothetical protein n=1 Tax=Pseudomonas aeruginosa TaxID=287 RepID=UPI003563B935